MLAVQHRESVVERVIRQSTSLIDRILELTPLGGQHLAITRLRDIVPEIPGDFFEGDLRPQIHSSTRRLVSQGLATDAPPHERERAQCVESRLRDLLTTIREGRLLPQGLTISRARELMEGNFIGAEGYSHVFETAVEKEPALPPTITETLLNSDCPFNRDQRLKIKETHLLTYIPATLWGASLSICNFARATDHLCTTLGLPRVAIWGEWFIHEPFANAAPAEGKWVLMPKHPLPDSHNRNWSEQTQKLSETPDYIVASARELAVSLGMNYLVNSERMFPHLGRCKERSFDRLIVNAGLSTPHGFILDRAEDHARNHIGLAIFRRLYFSEA